jgi:hypothetical protein
MTNSEYLKAKAALPGLRQEAKDSKFLPKFLEALITVKGHAWCMDVQSERRKMAKLISKEVQSALR